MSKILKLLIDSWKRYNIDMDYWTGEISAKEALYEYNLIKQNKDE